MAVDFFKKFIDGLDEDTTALASEGKSAAEFAGFIDTGSYIINAAISGNLFGGLPDNKAIVIAGDPTTGKTYLALAIIANFLKMYPSARVIYYDAEAAITKSMFEAHGIDPARVAIGQPDTIEQFRTQAVRVLDKYASIPVDDRFPLLMVLDSLSALSSLKETTDVSDAKDARDMTKAPLIKGAFRVIRMKLAKLKVPLIVTNHIYAVIGAYVPTKEMSGGSGAKYAADTIMFLSKAKIKDDDKDIIGNIITIKMPKSRLTKENTAVDSRIMYDGGLDRYYGLLPYAVDAGIVVKVGNKFKFPNGTSAFEKSILRSPQKYFTQDVLEALNEYLGKTFRYGTRTDEGIARSATVTGGSEDASEESESLDDTSEV